MGTPITGNGSSQSTTGYDQVAPEDVEQKDKSKAPEKKSDVPASVPEQPAPKPKVFSSPFLDEPQLSVFLVAQQDPSLLIGKALIQGVRYSQELGISQAKRIEDYTSSSRLQSEKILDVIKDRREQIAEALKKQGQGKKLGIGLLIAGIVASALTLGTATPAVAAVVATGTILAALPTIDELTGGKVFDAIIKLAGGDDWSDEKKDKFKRDLGLSLTIVGSALAIGGGLSASGAFSSIGNLFKTGGDDLLGAAVKSSDDVVAGSTKASALADDLVSISTKSADEVVGTAAKSADEVAVSATKQVDQADQLAKISTKSATETTEELAKRGKTVLEHLGIDIGSEGFLRLQQAEVLAGVVESILTVLNAGNDIKIAGHNKRVQFSRADEKELNAGILRNQTDVERLVDQQQSDQQNLVVKRIETIAALTDSWKASQLSYYTKS